MDKAIEKGATTNGEERVNVKGKDLLSICPGATSLEMYNSCIMTCPTMVEILS